jgi:hypothetical protein
MRTGKYFQTSLRNVKRASLSTMARRKRVAIIGQSAPLMLEASNDELLIVVQVAGQLD